jgi:hypothetical protein
MRIDRIVNHSFRAASMVAAVVLLSSRSAGAQDSAAPPAPAHPVVVPTLAPRPADVSSIDGIVNAYYAVVSGPAGQPRQWGRDRTLYWPGLRFFAAGVKRDGSPTVRVMTHQEFVDATDAGMVKNGFTESEIHRITYRIGNIAHVMSTYETHDVGTGPVTGRGVNSIDLYWDGKRWWITAASWDDERPGSPIPSELLK